MQNEWVSQRSTAEEMSGLFTRLEAYPRAATAPTRGHEETKPYGMLTRGVAATLRSSCRSSFLGTSVAASSWSCHRCDLWRRDANRRSS